ncbi:hypothetical protein P4S63_02085 [Pseudoalteromonas sp. B193]
MTCARARAHALRARARARANARARARARAPKLGIHPNAWKRNHCSRGGGSNI